MIKRFLFDSNLQIGETICFGTNQLADDLKHLRKVLRAKTGDFIEVMNGRGVVASAQIIKIEDKKAAAVVKARQEVAPPKIKIKILQGMLKGQRMDFCFEKLTELGIQNICIVAMERSHVRQREGASRMGRWQRLIKSAMKQSGNPFYPSVSTAPNLEDALRVGKPRADVAEKSLLLVATIDPTNPSLLTALQEISTPNIGNVKYDRINLVVGPESGFSEDELKLVEKMDSTAVYLGNTTLRSETASLLMAGIVKNWIDSIG